MRLRCCLILVVVVALVAFTISVLRAQPDNILLNHSEAFGKKERAPVAFPHGRHMEGGLSCKDCHHRYDKGKNVLDESELEEGNPKIRCSGCHGPHTRVDLQQAFHRQCVGCHRKDEKGGKKTGSLLCGECHPWKPKVAQREGK